MSETLRTTGLEVMSHLAWGSHFCNFYETKQDLLDILVPYFRSGMDNNEFCFWVTEDSIPVEDAKRAIQLSAPTKDHDPCLKNIEIVSYRDWYLRDGKFDSDRCLKGWHDILQQKLALGYEGLRVNGDENWLNEEMWQQFIDYEMKLNACVKGQRMVILCAYSLHKCSASAVLDVALVHEFAASKRRGFWEILETPALRQAKSELKDMNENLEQRITDRTEQLVLTCRELADEVFERKRVEEELRKSEASIRTIFEQTDIALMLLNSSLETLVENAASKTWSALARAAGRQEDILDMMRYGLRGLPINREIIYPGPDDATVWYQVKVNPVTSGDGDVIGLCVAAADISASKIHEIELSKLTSDLIQRNNDLESFASMVSHNLRAPVANILGISRLLREKPSLDTRSELEAALFASAHNLDVVIHDLNSILQGKSSSFHGQESV
jgi:PAS domain-containing protein